MANSSPTAAFLRNGDGRLFSFSVLSLRQQDQLAQFMRFSYMEEAYRHVYGLSRELAEYAIKDARERAEKIYPGTIEHGRELFTFRGLTEAIFLSGSKDPNPPSRDDAALLVEEMPDRAIEVVRKACGYETVAAGEEPKNEPLPVDQIIHLLCNEPYNHSPSEVWEMTLDDIAVIWQKAKTENGVDLVNFIKVAKERRKNQSLSMWERPSIWKSRSTEIPSRLSA